MWDNLLVFQVLNTNKARYFWFQNELTFVGKYWRMSGRPTMAIVIREDNMRHVCTLLLYLFWQLVCFILHHKYVPTTDRAGPTPSSALSEPHLFYTPLSTSYDITLLVNMSSCRK